MTRDQAVERLAAYIGGVVETFHRGEYPDDVTIEDTIKRGAERASPQSWHVVDDLLRTLGLVAVPANVVASLAAHPAALSDGENDPTPYHSVDNPECGLAGIYCLRCLARLALADAVLEQLGGGQ